MATIYTHAVVGLGLVSVYATRRMPWSFWALALLLPIVPDFDVFSSANYGSPLGHRGITHSWLFALWAGCFVASLTYRYFRVRFWSLSVLFFAIIASHGVLDALTWGGMEIPFFWPLEGRYGNWGLIPVSDLAFEIPDPRRSRALRSEMLWIWLPTGVMTAAVLVYRLRRRPQSANGSMA